ncbi:hypothetical protein D3C72_1985650 [compost metagenome]
MLALFGAGFVEVLAAGLFPRGARLAQAGLQRLAGGAAFAGGHILLVAGLRRTGAAGSGISRVGRAGNQHQARRAKGCGKTLGLHGSCSHGQLL